MANHPLRSRLLKKAVSSLTMSALFITTFLSFAPSTFAATFSVSNPVGSFPMTPIMASSGPVAALKFGVQASTTGKSLTAVTVSFSGTGFSTTDLAGLVGSFTSTSDGVELFRDNGSTVGSFDAGDSNVTSGSISWSGNNAVIVPQTPVSISNTSPTIFYVVIKTSGTISDGDMIIPSLGVGSITTDDAASATGPSTAFTGNTLRADTQVPGIASVTGYSGSNIITVKFSEPVQKTSPGGALSLSDSPLVYTDGGGTAQSITALAHTPGQDFATLTMSGNLEDQDVDVGPATIAAGSSKIMDMAGNVLTDTSAKSVVAGLSITTSSLPGGIVGAAYKDSLSNTVTLSAIGGTAPYTWAVGGSPDTSLLTALGLSLNSTGTLTGTINTGTSGSYPLNIKVTDSTGGTPQTVSKFFNINISGGTGQGVPGITAVNPPSGVKSSDVSVPTDVTVTVTGTNTTFTNSSTVQLLKNNAIDTDLVVTGVTRNSDTSLTFHVAIPSVATTGSRDVKVITGTSSVTMTGGFGITSAPMESGLSLTWPPFNATNVAMPPNFSFVPSVTANVNTYRISVFSTSDASGTPLWDYAFPTPYLNNDITSTANPGSHCGSTTCNVGYGAGAFTIITHPSQLTAGSTYYWQVRTYATALSSFTTSLSSLEATGITGFTTNSSLTDVTPPQIVHRPIFAAKASTALDVIARVTDNLATATTTPALSTKLYYCQGSSCTLNVADEGTNHNVIGSSLGNGFYKFTIPADANGIGALGVVTKYYLYASDGSNTARFAQPSNSPFSLTAVASGDVVSTITGSVSVSDVGTGGSCVGATVFADDFGSNATTDGSCAFTLSNLPAGSHDLVAFKTGYGDRRIDAVPVSTTGLVFNIKAGATGGGSGSATSPKVKYTGPPEDGNAPGDATQFSVFVVFDRAMSQSSVTATGNMKVNTFDGSSLTDITNYGTWSYYASSANVPAGFPPENNLAVWSLTGGHSFGQNKNIVVAVSSNVTDTSGNSIQGNNSDGTYSFSFNTDSTATFSGNTVVGGTFGQGQFVPPHVVGTNPPPGSLAVPTNAKYKVTVSDAMADDGGGYTLKDNLKLFTVSASGLETDVSSAAIDSTSLDGSKTTVTLNLKSSFNTSKFAANTKYRLKVLGGAKIDNGMTFMPPNQSSVVVFIGEFTTGASADTAAPSVRGSFPKTTATGVPVNVGAINVAFDKDMDSASFTSSTMSLGVGSTAVTGTVEYRANERQAYFIPKNVLSAYTTYALTLSGLSAANGQTLTDTTITFTTGAADSDAPNISFVNADDSSVAVTFSEPMNHAKITDSLNWSSSVLNPAVINSGSSTAIPTTAQFSYDAVTNTLVIKNLSLTVGTTFSIAFSGAKDLSGNAIGAGIFTSEVKNSAITKGNLAPGSGDVLSTIGAAIPQNFSSDTFGFAPPVEVKPFTPGVEQTSIYGVRLPISTQIPAGGKIVLTFPVGFDVSGAKQDVNSPMKNDLNGPGSGTVKFKCNTTVANGKACSGDTTLTGDGSGDTSTKGGAADDGIMVSGNSVTITLSAATNSEGHDFLSLDIAGIINTSVPKDFNTSGYTVDVKTKNAAGTATLESLTSMPFFIQSTGSLHTLSGTITATANNQSGTMQVYLMSPMTGPMSTTTSDFSGGTTATYSLSVPNGEYWIATDPEVDLGALEFQGLQPLKVVVSGDTTFNRTLSKVDASGTDVTVVVDGPHAEPLDIFASGQNGFKVRQVTLDNSDGPESFHIFLPNGVWQVGVGPQMPKGQTTAQPTAPSYLPPKPIQVGVNGSTITESSSTANDGVVVFTLTNSTKTIKGIVKDGNGKIVAGAQVFAYSPAGGFGTNSASDSAGTFSLGVVDGTYMVGAMVPGMPPSSTTAVTVTNNATTYLVIDGSQTAITPAAALASFVITIDNKSGLTISGKVTDGTNIIQGAAVQAYRTDAPGNAGAQTDTSGNYKIYVSAGTWKIRAFIPGYGQTTETTVVVGTSSVTGQDFSPTATGSTYYAVSGTVMSNGAAVQGASVRIMNSTGFSLNETKTATDGNYSFNIPSGSNYVIKAFVNGIESPAVGPFDVAGTTTGKNITIGTLRTITLTFSAAVPQAFVSACSSTGMCANNKVDNATTMTLSLPDGSYGLRIGVPGISSLVVAGTGGTIYDATTGILTVVSNEALSVTVPTLRTLTGTVTNGSAGVRDAWVELNDPTTGIHLGSKADSSGNFSVQIPDGTYQINAMKPGYFRLATSLVVNGTTGAQTLTLAAATASISGQILVGSSGVANAFVKAVGQRGGTITTQADVNGNYTLNLQPGTWNVYGQGQGYAQVAYTLNPIVLTTAATGKNITLTTTVANDAPTSNPFTPASGVTVDDGNGNKIIMPPNAAGNSSSSGTVTSEPTNNTANTSTATVVGGQGTEITAANGDGTPIKNLDAPITISKTYTEAELLATASSTDTSINTAAEADAIKMGYWDDTVGNWVTVPTTVTYENSSGAVITDQTTIDTAAEYTANVAKVVVTGTTDHLSLYAPIVPTNGLAPSTPSGLAATASSSSAIGLTWTLTSGATSYDIYRSTTSGGTFSRLGSEPTVSSGSTVTYSDTGLSASTTYYYKISALNAAGESTASSEVSATTSAAASTGGGGSLPSHKDQPVRDNKATVPPVTPDTSGNAAVTGEQGATATVPFADVKGHWAAAYVADLFAQGVVSGKDATHYDPDLAITRAEFLKIVLKTLGILVDEKAVTTTFKDVDGKIWYAPYIAAASAKGIIAGYPDKTFKPNGFVTRAEAVKIILVAAGITASTTFDAHFSDVPAKGAWFKDYVNFAAEKLIVSGYANGKFGPNNKLTRAEAAKIVSVLKKNLPALLAK